MIRFLSTWFFKRSEELTGLERSRLRWDNGLRLRGDSIPCSAWIAAPSGGNYKVRIEWFEWWMTGEVSAVDQPAAFLVAECKAYLLCRRLQADRVLVAGLEPVAAGVRCNLVGPMVSCNL